MVKRLPSFSVLRRKRLKILYYRLAVVLEGKYWKRDLLVISAEYKKWRRFHHHRTLEHSNALDTLSERDFDWSSNDDRSLNNIDECQWTSDLLFSTISQPFQFPDPREIGKPNKIFPI
uniref:Uncharacterized protein n=1 Tax=Phlebotomus papatasi TaxID=29031 RepID=A0A1B0DRE5_PHLPP